MARRVSSRVVVNRQALEGVSAAVANGVEEITRTIVETADPPDRTPYGVGLVDAGGWLVYSGSKKIGGGSLTGEQPKKPRGLKTPKDHVTGVAGYGFPGRFIELGVVHAPAEPFLLPAAAQVVSHAPAIMRDAMREKGIK